MPGIVFSKAMLQNCRLYKKGPSLLCQLRGDLEFVAFLPESFITFTNDEAGEH